LRSKPGMKSRGLAEIASGHAERRSLRDDGGGFSPTVTSEGRWRLAMTWGVVLVLVRSGSLRCGR
jgi:hypothetical protein